MDQRGGKESGKYGADPVVGHGGKRVSHAAAGCLLNAFGHYLHSVKEDSEGAEDFKNGDKDGPNDHIE